MSALLSGICHKLPLSIILLIGLVMVLVHWAPNPRKNVERFISSMCCFSQHGNAICGPCMGTVDAVMEKITGDDVRFCGIQNHARHAVNVGRASNKLPCQHCVIDGYVENI
eukprot:841629-Amphidinium_carterae.2